MDLWNEYEGRTIDGVYPLTKLLEPEGRSAFFATPNGSGTPAVIRLIEAHFDDEEILARWRGVQALNHPNLVKLKAFGKVELDGSPLVYAVMEPADANLGEIISERKLTADETKELSASLVAALEALHEHGFVHEHMEPGNVLAVGEEIKLRSDCIREAPEGEEGQALKRKDVHDLGVVLLRAMTQKRSLEEARGDLPLAAPMDAIVRKAIDGEWGLREISAALKAGPRVVVAAPKAAEAPAPRAVPEAARSVSAEAVAASLPPVARAEVERVSTDGPYGVGMSGGTKVALGGGVILLALLGWFALRGHGGEDQTAKAVPAPQAEQAAPAVPAVPTVKPSAAVTTPGPHALKPSPAVTASNATPKPAPTMGAPVVAATPAPKPSVVTGAPPVSAGSAGARVDWRVIVVTYNHEDQAKAKAARYAEKYPELHPDVFTPTGQAPYLVTIGGVMTRDQAFALVQKARGEGFPNETYAQNYKHQ
jgi:eukaryotic-like serine/threonine-protein kinase